MMQSSEQTQERVQPSERSRRSTGAAPGSLAEPTLAAASRDPDPLAAAFEEHRPLLFGIAYRMLGSVSEAEDIVQEAYLRIWRAPAEEIRSARAYLCTVVTRLCLDQLKSARAQRECYIGPWLPEPLPTAGAPTPEEVADEDDSVSMAFLVLLESLTPIERAVFLLHEVFDFRHDEIAAIVGRSEAACRQTLHRAKDRIADRRPRFQESAAAHERLATEFLHACRTGNLEGLLTLLSEDVTLWNDGGGKRAAGLLPIYGRANVVRLLGALLRKEPSTGDHARITPINGRPAIVAWRDGRPDFVATFDLRDGHICGLRVVLNPEKLGHLRPAGVDDDPAP